MSRLRQLFGLHRAQSPDTTERGEEPVSAQRWLVVGLGNPGARYRGSRHNLGFGVVATLAAKNETELVRKRFGALTGEIRLAGNNVLLVQPQTFYNLTGESVRNLMGYFKISIEQIVIVHDDLDLEPGRLRIKTGGGDAGNRGVRSIVEAVGNADFVRVRIGIGHPAESLDTADYVLEPIGETLAPIFEEATREAAAAVEVIIQKGLKEAMDRFNARLR